MSVGGREEGDAHFDRAVAPAADELVRDEVDAVDLVGVPREVVLELVRLQDPYLPPCRDVVFANGGTGRVVHVRATADRKGKWQIGRSQ